MLASQSRESHIGPILGKDCIERGVLPGAMVGEDAVTVTMTCDGGIPHRRLGALETLIQTETFFLHPLIPGPWLAQF